MRSLRVFAGGLVSPNMVTVIDNRDGQALFTDGPFPESDGPFPESKEYLAGFWIMETADLDVALNLAAEGPRLRRRVLASTSRAG